MPYEASLALFFFSALQLLPAQKGHNKNHRKKYNIGVFKKGNEEGYSELLCGILIILCDRNIL